MSRSQLPSLNALRAFEAAARHGSFARAGAELNVTAAAISHRIKELEQMLGIALFRRLPRGVEVTEPGQRYRDEIARALNVVERATEGLEHTSIDGRLRLSLPQAVAQKWLVPRVHRLTRRYPGLELQVIGDNRVVDLRAGEADLAIRFGQGRYPGLNVEFLMSDALTLLMSSQSLTRLSDTSAAAIVSAAVLLEDNWVGPDEPWMTWSPWLRELGLVTHKRDQLVRFSDSAMAISACHADGGVCIGRMSLSLEHLRRRELTTLMPWRTTDYAYHLVMRDSDKNNPRVFAFSEWLKDEVRDYCESVRTVTGFYLPQRVETVGQ
jgi:LysR family glycine cleavage system transcriptional activator